METRDSRRFQNDVVPTLRSHGDTNMDFIRRTIDLAMANVEDGGRPFACIIVKDGENLRSSP
jgi:tRNA(Arg) A34 adenosine deaminase TadA